MSKTVLGNRWRLDRSIARGGDGEVFRATDMMTQAPAAVKLLKPRLGAGEGFGAHLRREFDILKQLDHPSAARALDFGETSNHSIFMALEYVDGRTLTRVLLDDGPLAPARVAVMADHLAGAIDAAHALGILHRDIAPEHILCYADAAGCEAWKLLDFGMAKAPRSDMDDAARDAESAAVVLQGSARYVSPEAAAGKPPTSASDVYSLGAALYEAFVGVPPFEAEDEAALALAHLRDAPLPFAQANPEVAVPAAAEAAVMAALDKRPNRRPASAGDLATRLRTALGKAAQDIAVPAAGSAPNRFQKPKEPAVDRPLSLRERAQTPQRPIPVGPAAAARLLQRDKPNTVSWDNVAAAAKAPDDIVLKVKLSHAIIAALATIAVTGTAFLILRGG